MIYQMTFAIITVALVAGSVADRMRFSAFVWFAALWLIVVYVPIAHWVWGGGFLAKEGLLDFAGGTVVHLNAGIAGLVAAWVLGKRHGYGIDNFAPFDLSLAVIGTGLLWVGWFGFNGGSALRRQFARGLRDRRHPSRRRRRRAHLDGAGMVDARQAVGARHDLRRRRRSRHHHAGIRLRAAVARRRHRPDRRRDVLLGLHLAEAAARLRRFARRVRRARRRRRTGTLLVGVFAVAAMSVSADAPAGFPGLLEGNPETGADPALRHRGHAALVGRR